jgi:hypothetical protein
VFLPPPLRAARRAAPPQVTEQVHVAGAEHGKSLFEKVRARGGARARRARGDVGPRRGSVVVARARAPPPPLAARAAARAASHITRHRPPRAASRAPAARARARPRLRARRAARSHRARIARSHNC